jgi:hypothetical protein
MKGLSIMIYTILLTILYLVENSAFMAIAGAVKGTPIQVWAVADRVHNEIIFEDVVNIPNNMKTFLSGCTFPGHSSLTTDEIKEALKGCTHPQNASVLYPGVLCIFHDYQGYPYRICKGILYTPVETYYFDGTAAPIFTVVRDLEEGTIQLTQ